MFSDFGEKILLAFLEVDSAIQALCRHVLSDLKDLPVWTYNGSDSLVEDRWKVLHVLKHFGPTSTLSSQETISCPGAVACTEETSTLILAANQAKITFKKIIAECTSELKNDAMPFVHETLSRAGFSAIKLKQVTRTIPYINFHPRRIAWSIVKHSSNKLRSPEELKEDLLNAGQGEHIYVQCKKLDSLRSQEVLVVYHEILKVWQVNVASFKQEGRSSVFGQRSSLPLFYIHNPSLPTPTVCLSQQRELSIRKQRSDKNIEDQVFLPSVNAHRRRKIC